MKFLSLKPFVPSGSDFQRSRDLFLELGFNIAWESPGAVGFERDQSAFILQHFDNKEFAENFMITVRVDSADLFRNHALEKKLPERFGIRVGEVTSQPYGKEVNIIDIAGVCWHFVE